MSSENVIELNSISKCYLLYNQPQDRLKQMLFGRRRKFYKEFWALNDISLKVKKGECLGIIGRNGAGKSTLLQIISGIVSPTSGTASMNGKVAALLELGTGFNPDFSGRENVYLNGSILGLSQSEIEERYNDILAFADIGDFIHQPVKTYSSGMMVRLAFAVAVHVDPEILIIDEALSVGDAKFQAKCFRKFQEFRDAKKTILFVTHTTEQVVRHCDYAILLEKGRLIEQGDPLDVTNKYLSLIFDTKPAQKSEQKESAISTSEPENRADISGDKTLENFIAERNTQDQCPMRPGYNNGEHRWGNRDAEIIDYLIGDSKNWHKNHFESGDKVQLFLKVRFNRDVSSVIYGLTVKTPDGVTVYGSNSKDLTLQSAKQEQAGSIRVLSFTFSGNLNAGHFLLSLGVVDDAEKDVIPLDRRYDLIEIYFSKPQKIYGLVDLGMQFKQHS